MARSLRPDVLKRRAFLLRRPSCERSGAGRSSALGSVKIVATVQVCAICRVASGAERSGAFERATGSVK
ncbi:MAG: hypothetical protein IJO46_11455, partial [Thermoguttaceae bacterium]|nr:hypothetical protein [Thermoguttaceae bacterium]